ncbi:MAG: MEKHLA domain-containing protein [Candidatus Nanopelagicales bacterium]
MPAFMGHDINDPVIVQAILDSHASRIGTELIERTGEVGGDAEALFTLNAVILSHDGGDDPHFVYANQAAADLWRMPVSELIGMPSRLSAPLEHQAERASMLTDAAGSGVLSGYAGERIAKDGTRFMIEDATLWTVDFPQGPGQAVVFTTWTYLPKP